MGIEKVTQQQRFTSPNIVIGGDNIPIDTGLSVYGKITTTDNIRSGNNIHASGDISTDKGISFEGDISGLNAYASFRHVTAETGLNVANGNLNVPNGTVTGNSLISNNGLTVNNGNLDLTGGSLVNADAINANSLISNNGVTVNNGNLSVPNGTITGNSLVSNNGVTVNNGSLNVPNGTITGNSLVSNNGLTVNNGNLSVPNGTVTATSVNATNITVTNSITNTNNTPFIKPQDLLPGDGAVDGALLRYNGNTTKWEPYQAASVGLGRYQSSFDPRWYGATNTGKLSTFNSAGSVFNPITITGVTPWKKIIKIADAARGNAGHADWSTPYLGSPVLYRKMFLNNIGVISWNYTGTSTNARSNFSPSISIQGVRADGTIRGRLGNVRVTSVNVVTGVQAGTGTTDPNTGMVTGGTIVAVSDGTITQRQQCPASNTNYVIVTDVDTSSTNANGPQNQPVSILSAGDFRQLHPECGDNQNGNGTTTSWNITESQFRYAAPWYSLPTFRNDTTQYKNFGTSFNLELNYIDSGGWPNTTIFQNNGTIIHMFTYELKAFMYGSTPVMVTIRGEMSVYDDVFNPNVSYNIVLYPPKQMASDADETAGDIVSRIFEGRIAVTY